LTLAVCGRVLAGAPLTLRVEKGQCVQITTGAVMPEGLDTVIPKELVVLDDKGQVVIAPGTLRQGDNRRFRGEDLAQGKAALSAGTHLGPAALGLIASLGLAQVQVQRRLRVAVFSTGDEILSLGQAPRPGAVYDSNRYTLHGMLTQLGCSVVDMGAVPDQPEALEAAFRSAVHQSDVVVTSGGVSVGEADHTKAVMARLGADPMHPEQGIGFWRIAMRPGRPMAFGSLPRPGAVTESDRVLVFGLPGNPVAVMVTFMVFVRPALLQLQGRNQDEAMITEAQCEHAISKKKGRTEYLRGRLARSPSGRVTVAVVGNQGSGVLRSMSEAHCLIQLPPDCAGVEAGQSVHVMPFSGFL
jgi:molybdopterin molybdotransferase